MALISVMNWHRFQKLNKMHKENKKYEEIRKIWLNSRALADNACPFCGAPTYHLVLRWDTQSQTDELFARCAQCQRPR
jgi:hypothetical protein